MNAPHNMRSRSEPGERQDGVEGNSRLTATAGLVLLVLLAVEGVTILRIGPLLTEHVVIGPCCCRRSC